IDHAMEDDAVIEAVAHQFLDACDMVRRDAGQHLDEDVALRGFELEGVFWIGHLGLPSFLVEDYRLASACTCARTMRSGLATGSPRLSLSTFSMPETTSPMTVYWPFRCGASANMMKNWQLAEFGS